MALQVYAAEMTKGNTMDSSATCPSNDGFQSPKPPTTLCEKKQSKRKYDCDICGKPFPSPSKVLKHKKSVHPLCYLRQQAHPAASGVQDRKHRCDVCEKGLSSTFNVLRHKKIVHGIELPNKRQEASITVTKYWCQVCHKYFTRAVSLRKHETNVHQLPKERSERANFKCSECFSCFPTKASFVEHLARLHRGIVLATEHVAFESHEEFEKWKTQMEKDTASLYVKVGGYRSSSAVKVQKYGCHRSGCYKPEGEGKRRLKSARTNKIGFFCPSHISTRSYETPNEGFRVDVTFHSTHVGHQCEAHRLRLLKQDKNEIAGQLSVGAPTNRVLLNISET